MKNKIINSLKSKKWLILLVVALVLVPFVAHAQASVATETTTAINSTLNSITAMLAMFLKFLQTLLWPIMLMIGGLLNNDILFGAGMEDRLLDIWVHVRNFVNIGFVIVLLGIAIYNVSGMAEDNYSLKAFLPKFAIALILVNFSFMAMKVIVDVTNVVTVAIFTLPSSIAITDGDANKKLAVGDTPEVHDKICANMYGGAANLVAQQKKLTTQSDVEEKFYCKPLEGNSKKLEFTTKGEDFFRRFSANNASLILAVQMMNVIDADKVSTALQAKDAKISDLGFNILFSVVLYLVYGSAYVALFVVLLVRLVVLWLFIPLSPVIAFTWVMPNLLGDSAGGLQEKFIKHVLVPIKIAIPMTLGYLILESFRAIKFTEGVEVSAFVQNAANMKLPVSGLSDVQSMIIAFAAVAVVWIGVFEAANDTLAAGVTNFIKDKVTGLGKAAVSVAKYTPLIPTGRGGAKASLDTMGKLLTSPLDKLEQKANANFNRLSGNTNVSVKDIGNVKTAMDLRNLIPSIKKTMSGKTEKEKKKYMKAFNKRLSQGDMRKLRGELGKDERGKANLSKLQRGTLQGKDFETWLGDFSTSTGLKTTTAGKTQGQAATGSATTPPVKKVVDTEADKLKKVKEKKITDATKAIEADIKKNATAKNATEKDNIKKKIKDLKDPGANIGSINDLTSKNK